MTKNKTAEIKIKLTQKMSSLRGHENKKRRCGQCVHTSDNDAGVSYPEKTLFDP